VNYPNTRSFMEEMSKMGLEASAPMFLRITSAFSMEAQDAGEYTFNLISSDGSLLIIDGEEVVSNDGVHGTRSMSSELFLTEGDHSLEILYFKRYLGEPVLSLRWGGGPFRLMRMAFEFEPDWEELRKVPEEPSCNLQAPNSNEAGVAIRYGFTKCHSSCMSCIVGGESAADCTTCKAATPHHTVLNPRHGTGTCTERLCPLCKPKECCEKGHRHFIIDAESMNGVCLKPTDDCKAHCVTHSELHNGETRSLSTCTKGCNDIIKVPGTLLFEELQLFDVVICQADKTVSCTTPIGTTMNRRSLLGLPEETPPVGSTTLKVCSSSKTVTTEAVCPDLDEDSSSVVFSGGPTCILDVLAKVQCDRDAEGQCIKSAAGTYVGCAQLDQAPLVCALHVSEHVRDSLSCSCRQVQQKSDMCAMGGGARAAAIGYEPLERHTKACETVAGTF